LLANYKGIERPGIQETGAILYLSELATLVYSLVEAEPHRTVELVISDGLGTQGDKPLMMQLMLNLLGNALTSLARQREPAATYPHS